MHNVADGHHGQPRGDTSAAAATAAAGGDVGGKDTDNGKAKSGSGSKTTGGGGLEKEPTALLSGAALAEGSAAGVGVGAAEDGIDQKGHGGKHTLRTTAVRLAMKISETSMVRRGENAQLFVGSHSHARASPAFLSPAEVRK